MSQTAKVTSQTVIRTTEMHSGGEPVRIVESGGYPDVIPGGTLLERRRYVREHLDHVRRFLMWEPRGHRDMYGAVILDADSGFDADLAVLFMHNEGYSTMCGHATIALGRYAVDRELVKLPAGDEDTAGQVDEVPVRIQCPCGVVRAFVERKAGKTTGKVRFHSVPAFAFALDVEISVKGLRSRQGQVADIKVDIGYGGAFYAIVIDRDIGLNVHESTTADIVYAASLVSEAVRAKVKLYHPDSEDLAFLYGTIVTDGLDAYSDQPTFNLTIFADREVDRAPTGSGVTARVAVQFARGLIDVGRRRTFQSAANGSQYSGSVVGTTRLTAAPGTTGLEGQPVEMNGVIVEVSGTGHYTGTATFTAEDTDQLKDGFLLK